MTIPNQIIVTPESGLISEGEDGNFTLNASVLEALAAQQASFATNAACSPCAGPSVACEFFWALGAAKLENGDAQTITVVGAPPGLRIAFHFDMPNGAVYDTNIVTDDSGKGTKRIVVLNGNGSYTVTATACGCVPRPTSLNFAVCAAPPACAEVVLSTSATPCVLAAGNLFSGGAIYSQGCDRAVTVTPKFLTPTVNSGGYASLEITVSNTNNVPVTFSLGNVTLPPELSGTVAIPQTVINGQATLVRTFTLTATSGVDASAVITIGNGVGTYICNGSQYSASGGQDLVSVIAPSSGLGCDLRVETFAWVPANIANGGTTQLQLTLKNYGSVSVTDLAISAISGPTTFTGGALTASGVTIAPGATFSVNSTGVIEHTASTAQTLTAFAPAGTITYKCGGVPLNIGAPIQSSVVVAAGTISNGYCSGTLTWEVPISGTVRVLILGALANATYNYTISGAYAASNQVTTDASGDAYIDISYTFVQAGSQVVVAVSIGEPGNCQFPEMSLQLPPVETP